MRTGVLTDLASQVLTHRSRHGQPARGGGESDGERRRATAVGRGKGQREREREREGWRRWYCPWEVSVYIGLV